MAEEEKGEFRYVTRGEDGKLRELTPEERAIMKDGLPDSLFRKLSTEEEQEFRRWARENFKEDTKPNLLWHPVVRDEWQKMQEMHEELKKEGYPGGKPFPG